MPKKGTHIAPNVAGTPGKLTELPAALVFGGLGRISPYDALLLQLEKACDEAKRQSRPLPGLEFTDVKAKPSVYARAKKLGYRVAFAEDKGRLYVRFDGLVSDDKKALRRKAIIEVLSKPAGTALKYIEITNRLRAAGDELLEAATVDAILCQMLKTGEVIKTDAAAWRLNPKKHEA